MNQILQGWKRILHDYWYWKMIIQYPYDVSDRSIFFSNLGKPQISLEDWVKEMKRLDELAQEHSTGAS